MFFHILRSYLYSHMPNAILPKLNERPWLQTPDWTPEDRPPKSQTVWWAAFQWLSFHWPASWFWFLSHDQNFPEVETLEDVKAASPAVPLSPRRHTHHQAFPFRIALAMGVPRPPPSLRDTISLPDALRSQTSAKDPCRKLGTHFSKRFLHFNYYQLLDEENPPRID